MTLSEYSDTIAGYLYASLADYHVNLIKIIISPACLFTHLQTQAHLFYTFHELLVNITALKYQSIHSIRI